jgi:ssRNA-specific RNase YbeY (16S rRNA maturation enzyme)
LLHLVGYDDKDAHDRKQMRVRERYHLNGLGLPDIGP